MFLHTAGLLSLTYAVNTSMVVAFAIMHGWGWGLRGPFMQAIRADYFGRSAIGLILGLSFMIVVLGQIGGGMISGILADATGNYRLGFTVVALLAGPGIGFLPAREEAGAACAQLAVHQLLDLFGLDRDVLEEVLGAALANDDVVLEPHAEPFLRDVDPGLDGNHPPFAERFLRPAVVVHVEAERVPQTVHVVLAARGLLFGLVLDVRALEQPELEQLLVHHQLRLFCQSR
jgi:MFS family permease